jgi:hypothetical protein
MSTFATLTILPSIYAILQGRASTKPVSLNPMDPLSEYYDAGDFPETEETIAVSESK